MHANGRLWYYLFGKDIGCALLCRIFRILKRILVWNWQLLKQARIRSWESWSARWSYRWATSRKRLPRLRRTSEWMRRTYVMDLCPNTFWRVSSSIPLSMARTANAWRPQWNIHGKASDSEQVKIKRKPLGISDISVFCKVEKMQTATEYWGCSVTKPLAGQLPKRE